MKAKYINNYNNVKKEVFLAAEKAGRDPHGIKIIAVSKTFPSEIVQNALDEGISLIGESKVQEAKKKVQVLNGNFTMDMIGHLQSNKVKDAVKIFDTIHTIDKFTTAEKIDVESGKIEKRQKILLQVNISGEESKRGFTEENLLKIYNQYAELKYIEVSGLMTMAPYTDNEEVIRKTFKGLKKLLDKINALTGHNLTELSMGMSSDYKIAVEEGATIIRVGRAIFGERDYR